MKKLTYGITSKNNDNAACKEEYLVYTCKRGDPKFVELTADVYKKIKKIPGYRLIMLQCYNLAFSLLDNSSIRS